MSLKDPDDDFDDQIDLGKKFRKRSKGGGGFSLTGDLKFKLVILLLGIILGIFLSHYFVEPMIGSFGREDCATCLTEKEYLKMTNNCLLKEVEGAQDVLNTCAEANKVIVPDSNE